MRRLPVLVLIGALAAGGLTGCGDDERRQAALDKSFVPRLSLTVVTGPNASGWVAQDVVYNGLRVGGTSGTSCASAAAPGRTCTWDYQLQCSADPDCSAVSLRLRASTELTWEGCLWTGGFGGRECVVELPGSVKATFATKASVPKLTLTVVTETSASGSVVEDVIYNGRRAGGTSGTSCASAPAPGRTCTWEYERQCSVNPDCAVSLRLFSAPPVGGYVLWEGCTPSSLRECVLELPGTVKARLVSKASLPTLSLTVVKQGNASGSVNQGTVVNGRRADGTSGATTCVSALEPGTTCNWDFEKVCPSSDPCHVEVFLTGRPAAGTLVNWTGCSKTFTHPTNPPTHTTCQVALAGTVKATFVVDPKASTG
jgi:hypothetical protein